MNKPVPERQLANVKMTEYQLQSFCVQWLQYRGLDFLHVPNEGKRNLSSGARLKKMGMMKGFPDIYIFSRPPRFPSCRGIAFELKVGKNKLTTDQKRWLAILAACGCWTAEIRTPEQFLAEMQRLGWA